MKRKFEVSKTTRAFIEGNENGKGIIVALHGYGQLPEFFIKKFESLYQDYLIICPEGLHRFYLKNAIGRVGASWMTKEEREDDIQDNQNYLSQIFNEIYISYHPEKIILLGFSQGGATAARYYFSELNNNIHHLILWATVFPPDISPSQILKDGDHNFFVLGDQDEYYDAEKANEIIMMYEKLNFKTLTFRGNHDIHEDTLRKILTLF